MGEEGKAISFEPPCILQGRKGRGGKGGKGREGRVGEGSF